MDKKKAILEALGILKQAGISASLAAMYGSNRTELVITLQDIPRKNFEDTQKEGNHDKRTTSRPGN